MSPTVWTLIGTVVVALSGAGASVLVAKLSAKGARRSADAQVQEALNNGFQALTQGLQNQLKLTRGELEETRGELTFARQEMIELRGWVRELIQHIDSLEVILRSAGIDVPRRRPVPHVLTIIEGRPQPLKG